MHQPSRGAVFVPCTSLRRGVVRCGCLVLVSIPCICGAVHCDVLQCVATHCGVMRCVAVRWGAVLDRTAVWRILVKTARQLRHTPHRIALYGPTSHRTAPHRTAPHRTVAKSCVRGPLGLFTHFVFRCEFYVDEWNGAVL